MIPTVWAPIPQQVRLWVQRPGAAEPSVEPMHPTDGGWWAFEGADLAPGTRYGFVLDDAGDDADTAPLPDPRGRRLPDGVHGTSEVVAEQPPPTDGWAGRGLAGGVIAEVHIGTFTPDGTLDSAIERLDHLVDLGIDFVELLPVNAFNGTWNWGYDGVAWYTVQESYGGPDAYRRFVAAAHARGLAVIQDVVYNHLGPSGNYLPRFGPYLRTGSRNTWGDSVNLDEAAVREYILDNARMWVAEYGVDGLRLDAVHALLDTSERHILRELGDLETELAEGLGRPITFIAESDLNDAVMIDGPDAGGYGLRAQWSDDYHHAVHVALTGETDGYYADFAPLSALAKASAGGFFHDGTFSSFRERDHGRPIPPTISPSSLVTFSQDHDQIGNRAAGDRLSATLSPERLAVGAVLTICSPFTPMIFMGEEWGASTPWQFFTSHPEADLGRIVAEGRVAEFAKMGWDPSVVPDPQDPATFANSKLDWSELERSPHRELLATYRELIALRRAVPDLGGVGFPALSAEADDDARTFTLRMGSVGVLVNLGGSTWTPELAAAEVLFRTANVSTADPLVLPPDSAAVVALGAPHPSVE